MRIAGAILIFIAFLAGGLTIVNEKKRHRDALSELCFALELVSSELGAKNTALPELMLTVSQRTTRDVQQFFIQIKISLIEIGSKPFSSIWAAAADNALNILTPEELSELKKLGCIIGRYDINAQMNALKSAFAYFHSQSESARKSLPEERRLCIGLAASAGAMLAILFI